MTEYIKREDALKICEGEIQDIRYETDVFGRRYERVVGARRINAYEIAEQIKKIPSVDVVERKKGKWLHTKITADFHAIGQCSVCKEIRRIDNFCPNCGADMRCREES